MNINPVISLPVATSTFSATVTSSSGLLVTLAGNHGLKPGAAVTFTAATLPTGITAGVSYYVTNDSSFSATAFHISTSAANAGAGTAVSYTDAGTTVVCVMPYLGDLSSSHEGELIKLVPTGATVCTNVSDRFIGTLLQGNVYPALGQSTSGFACDVLLAGTNGLAFVKVGNSTAILMGDELEPGTTDGTLVKRVAGPLAGIAVDSCPASSTSGLIRAIVFPPSQTGTIGTAGVVTQATSASTGVTVNALSGSITTVALTAAAAAEIRFTVTNSTFAIGDTVSFSTTYNGGGTPSIASAVNATAGTFDIVVTNLNASAAFDAAMVINFVIHKAALA